MDNKLTQLIAQFGLALDQVASQIVTLKADAGQWYVDVAEMLAQQHMAAYSAGRGIPWDKLPAIERDQVWDTVGEQLDHLENFADQYSSRYRDAPAAFKSRLQLYAPALKASWWEGKTWGIPLPAQPGDGTTQCITHCRCAWSIKSLGEGNYDATWVLGSTDTHCQSCQIRASRWAPLKIRDGAVVTTKSYNVPFRLRDIVVTKATWRTIGGRPICLDCGGSGGGGKGGGGKGKKGGGGGVAQGKAKALDDKIAGLQKSAETQGAPTFHSKKHALNAQLKKHIANAEESLSKHPAGSSAHKMAQHNLDELKAAQAKVQSIKHGKGAASTPKPDVSKVAPSTSDNPAIKNHQTAIANLQKMIDNPATTPGMLKLHKESLANHQTALNKLLKPDTTSQPVPTLGGVPVKTDAPKQKGASKYPTLDAYKKGTIDHATAMSMLQQDIKALKAAGDKSGAVALSSQYYALKKKGPGTTTPAVTLPAPTAPAPLPAPKVTKTNINTIMADNSAVKFSMMGQELSAHHIKLANGMYGKQEFAVKIHGELKGKLANELASAEASLAQYQQNPGLYKVAEAHAWSKANTIKALQKAHEAVDPTKSTFPDDNKPSTPTKASTPALGPTKQSARPYYTTLDDPAFKTATLKYSPAVTDLKAHIGAIEGGKYKDAAEAMKAHTAVGKKLADELKQHSDLVATYEKIAPSGDPKTAAYVQAQFAAATKHQALFQKLQADHAGMTANVAKIGIGPPVAGGVLGNSAHTPAAQAVVQQAHNVANGTHKPQNPALAAVNSLQPHEEQSINDNLMGHPAKMVYDDMTSKSLLGVHSTSAVQDMHKSTSQVIQAQLGVAENTVAQLKMGLDASKHLNMPNPHLEAQHAKAVAEVEALKALQKKNTAFGEALAQSTNPAMVSAGPHAKAKEAYSKYLNGDISQTEFYSIFGQAAKETGSSIADMYKQTQLDPPSFSKQMELGNAYHAKQEYLKLQAQAAPPTPYTHHSGKTYHAYTKQSGDAYGQKHYKAFLDALPAKEIGAIHHYTSSGYGYNTTLRDIAKDPKKQLAPTTKAKVHTMDTIMEKSPGLPDNVQLHRGFSSESLINRMEAGLDLHGTTFRDPGFASTSIDKDSAFKSSIRFKINAPAGTKGIYVNSHSSVKGENEFLLPRDSRFGLRGYKKMPGAFGGSYWEVEVDYLGTQPVPGEIM